MKRIILCICMAFLLIASTPAPFDETDGHTSQHITVKQETRERTTSKNMTVMEMIFWCAAPTCWGLGCVIIYCIGRKQGENGRKRK